MIGTNVIELNEATIIEALQYYFDNVMFQTEQCVTVTSIKPSNNSGRSFTVYIESPSDEG